MGAPLSVRTITALAKLVDDSQQEGHREPSHSDLDFHVEQTGCKIGDPRAQGRPVGKAKRVRAILNWALDHNPSAGERFAESLVAVVQGCGGFREGSDNFVGEEAIQNTITAFRLEGYALGKDGELSPVILKSLSCAELTAALESYTRRAQRGVMDAALLAGTGKDLLEAVAKHILNVARGEFPVTNFPQLLGLAFLEMGLSTPGSDSPPDEPAISRYERALYEIGCSVNALRNREGTGHGRPFLTNLTEEEARNAVEAMGLVSGYLLGKLQEKER